MAHCRIIRRGKQGSFSGSRTAACSCSCRRQGSCRRWASSRGRSRRARRGHRAADIRRRSSRQRSAGRSPHSRLARMCWAPERSPRSLAVPRRIAIRKWHASRSVPQLSRDIPRLEPRPPRPRQSSGSPWGRPRGRRDSLATCYGGGSGIATGAEGRGTTVQLLTPAGVHSRCRRPRARGVRWRGCRVSCAGRTGRTGAALQRQDA